MKVAYLAGMNVSASGLAAQRAVMDAAAENLANVETTKTETGDPYRRKVVNLSSNQIPFSSQLDEGMNVGNLARTDRAHLQAQPLPSPLVEGNATGVAAQTSEDMSQFPEVFDPGNPDADAQGMVRMPNVETAQEMVTLMTASRAYEANVAALQASRNLANASLNLAR